ncbi:hypothetical protein lpari_02458 [Legionella parisiensis]|uniref:Uncharacterized protein n=1 Tax=Legionella parisiensis TaxID=45071 RepID=A0A1E5JPP4_9GAMM|nr:hypothetical protein lpari_02458 [Legionella parisiensis]STX72055.1 Uncharacterised protein [Legionella parisiensis]
MGHPISFIQLKLELILSLKNSLNKQTSLNI